MQLIQNTKKVVLDSLLQESGPCSASQTRERSMVRDLVSFKVALVIKEVLRCLFFIAKAKKRITEEYLTMTGFFWS